YGTRTTPGRRRGRHPLAAQGDRTLVPLPALVDRLLRRVRDRGRGRHGPGGGALPTRRPRRPRRGGRLARARPRRPPLDRSHPVLIVGTLQLPYLAAALLQRTRADLADSPSGLRLARAGSVRGLR